MVQLYPVYLLWNRRKTLTGSPDPTRANGTNKPCTQLDSWVAKIIGRSGRSKEGVQILSISYNYIKSCVGTPGELAPLPQGNPGSATWWINKETSYFTTFISVILLLQMHYDNSPKKAIELEKIDTIAPLLFMQFKVHTNRDPWILFISSIAGTYGMHFIQTFDQEESFTRWHYIIGWVNHILVHWDSFGCYKQEIFSPWNVLQVEHR